MSLASDMLATQEMEARLRARDKSVPRPFRPSQVRIRQECPHYPMKGVARIEGDGRGGLPMVCGDCGGEGYIEKWVSLGKLLGLFEYETGQRVKTEVLH